MPVKISGLRRYQLTGIFFMTKNIKIRASFHKSLESIDKNEKELYTEYV